MNNSDFSVDRFTAADHQFMGVALALARSAASDGEVPVGAVLVRNGRVMAGAANRPISDTDPCAHAELLVIREAARMLGNYRLPGCSLYVTLEPCVMCAGAIIHARLERVIFAASDPKTGAAGGCFELLPHVAHNHQPMIQGGLRADESTALLKQFFAARR